MTEELAPNTENARIPKVFLINYSGHDFSPAKKWGEIEIITSGFVDPKLEDRTVFNILEPIHKNSHSEDWLVVGAGLALVNVMACILWMRKHGKLKMLLWNRKEGEESDYHEKIITDQYLDFMFEMFAKLESAA